MSLPPSPVRRTKVHQHRMPQGRTAGLVLLGDMVAHETGISHGLGPATAAPDQMPAEEAPALPSANATAALEPGDDGRRKTA